MYLSQDSSRSYHMTLFPEELASDTTASDFFDVFKYTVTQRRTRQRKTNGLFIYFSFSPQLKSTWTQIRLAGAASPLPPLNKVPSLRLSRAGSRAGTPTCGTPTRWRKSALAFNSPSSSKCCLHLAGLMHKQPILHFYFPLYFSLTHIYVPYGK